MENGKMEHNLFNIFEFHMKLFEIFFTNVISS